MRKQRLIYENTSLLIIFSYFLTASEFISNKEKDDMYEIQIRNHILFSLKKPAYFYSDTPVQILIDNGIDDSYDDHRLKRIANKEAKLNPLRDTGVDIIQLESDGSCTLVLCINGWKDDVAYSRLASFSLLLLHYPKLYGHVYYTDKISNNIQSFPPNPRLSFIKQPFMHPTTIKIADTVDMKPYQYQLDVVKNFKEKFRNGGRIRGILSMPCGTGKTYESYLLSKDRKQIIILSPLKQHAKQSLDKFIEYGYSKDKSLLVDSDGERDIDNIKKFIEENNSFLMSATFWSIDVIRKVLPFMKNPLIFVDEFHNLSKRNVMDKNDDFYGVLNSEHDILFMSATPRVYEIEEDDDRVGSAVNDDYNQKIFGPIIDSMSFRYAIENKYTSDYKIWLPSISSNDEQLNKELSIYDINPKLKDKCNFLLLSLS
jgi:predicted helicase